MGSGRTDIDAHAFEREHLQSFDFGYNLTFFDYKIFRMIVIVDVVVHSFASDDGFLTVPYINRNPRAGRGFLDPTLVIAAPNRLLFAHGLGPLVVRIGITFSGHDALDTPLTQFFFELLTDIRIFVGIFDLVFGAVFDFLRMTMELHRRMERQVARHVAAGIEMLVEPLVRRRDHAAFVPRADDLFFTFLPHDRIAFTGRNDDGTTWTMPMRFLVGFRGEDRHVRGQF